MASSTASLIRHSHASQSPTTNIVKYYIPKYLLPCFAPIKLPTILSLAYRGASVEGQYPRVILIRSSIHLTRYRKRGRTKQLRNTWHMTISYKSAAHLAKGSHLTAHIYVMNKHHPVFLRANLCGERPDTAKQASGRAVWGSMDNSEHITREVAYGYLPQWEQRMSDTCGRAYTSREKRQPWEGRGGLIRFVLSREKETIKE
ncbi:hypothetical protein BO99DRAFT_429686 [Aspergillus violaceofuscus CBS 115571]|uniref:Uncharacterized protein n=1 Tax=Aspergillus violaceofuscus (strain CBS 115571) TaxID=1450538 RepID=A0A2V5HEH3_ASPV1|nr:hypothetical protein BO99DRAFT_429686 [Aspergillus violaceofuscus CBS 115571]